MSVRVLRASLAPIEMQLPESVFDKIELYDLKIALDKPKPISVHIELTQLEYQAIKKLIYGYNSN